MAASMPAPQPASIQASTAIPAQPTNESYAKTAANEFQAVADQPLSTFSIDVDTASYSNIRRFLNGGSLPPAEAVRVEEMINYFHYDLPAPKGEDPFSVNTTLTECPWAPTHQLLRIALEGKVPPAKERGAANLVFLVDVSGSMMDANKLPLVKQSLKLSLGQLRPQDRVALVVYAGGTGTVLAPTRCDNEGRLAIARAIDSLGAGGGTNGAGGIIEAYRLAEENFVKGGMNRVVLATDGDFNVGVTSQDELVKLIQEKAKSGVFLTVLGVGTGNLKDSTMEQLADKGNGNYAYIDNLSEGRKVLVEQAGGTFVTIAKDVKVQIEFNPAAIAGYRLIGYENRMLAAKDFNDDKKDAGEIGAGHTVTALYELVPAGIPMPGPSVDPLKYQRTAKPADADNLAPGEALTVKLRYKQPDGETSKLLRHVVKIGATSLAQTNDDTRFATAVAAFGMLLVKSQYLGDYPYDAAIDLAKAAKGKDDDGLRAECINLMKTARDLAATQPKP